tara:strand:- start:59 stop:847 length:789 start_codon:yes stop_codon:yes gene_type:complete
MSSSNCGCKSSMDIRGRCCPYKNNKQFLECPARLDTALIHFENNYEISKELETDDYSEYTKIISKFLKSIKIKYWRDTTDFTEMFIKSVEDGKWNTEKIEATRDLEFEKKMMKKDWLKFNNKTGIDLCYVKGFELKGDEDYSYSVDYSNWYIKMSPVWNEFDDKINKERHLRYGRVLYDLRDLYKILDAQHSDYFKERHFNKYQFRVGRIVQTSLFNDTDYQSYKIVKVTKNYLEAYPIYYDGSCGDTRKFTKPSQFKRFQY